jgi:hypothetical protein
LKNKDKDLFDNPLADKKEGPTVVEQKVSAFKNLWKAIKDGITEWGIGSVPPPPPPRRKRPKPPPPPPPRKPKGSDVCERCGTVGCISDEDWKRRKRRGGSSDLLRSCNVRRQLKQMEKLKLRTSSGKTVYLTKHGRIEDKVDKMVDEQMKKVDETLERADKTLDKAMKDLDDKMKDMDKKLSVVFDKKRTRPPVR